MTASTICGERTSMIALVRPACIAMARNPAPSAARPGMPNETLEAPRVMLRPSSSWISSMVRRVVRTSDVSAPTGIASGSITMSSTGMPYSPTAMSTIFLVISSRRSGSSGISSSSLGRAITAAPCRATIGRIASSRSRSPVTELTSALPR